MGKSSTVRRVKLDAGGYDRSGAYWGIGKPLYWYAFERDGKEESGHTRATDRHNALMNVAVIMGKFD